MSPCRWCLGTRSQWPHREGSFPSRGSDHWTSIRSMARAKSDRVGLRSNHLPLRRHRQRQGNGSVQTVTPNPSLEPTRYGRHRLAPPGYAVHCPSAAKRRQPPRAAQLKRWANAKLGCRLRHFAPARLTALRVRPNEASAAAALFAGAAAGRPSFGGQRTGGCADAYFSGRASAAA